MDATGSRAATHRAIAGVVAVAGLVTISFGVGRCTAPAAAREVADTVEVSIDDIGLGGDFTTAAANAIVEVVANLPTTTTTVVTVSAPANTAPTTTEAQFFECVRWRESRGDYTAVNPTGTFRGAYQFYQGGWDHYAAQVAPDYVGVPPDQAPPAVQDAVAHQAYVETGRSPWGGYC